MALFEPRTYTQILGDMVTTLTAVTPLTDVNYGSVWVTMLEAAATEDDEQYWQMLEIIRGYSIDEATGQDLDDRAWEYGLERLKAKKATTTVTISDSVVTKVFTSIFSGLAGPIAGDDKVKGDSLVGFPPTGSIIFRGNDSTVEIVPYSSITDFGSYVEFNLSAQLQYDHGTEENLVLAQGGDRVVSAGAVVLAPASDFSPQIQFTLDAQATILNGEEEIRGVAVTAAEAGAASNVPVGAIRQFDSLPFPSAKVTNPEKVTSGTNEETDQELRDRIKDTIQSLSRGTKQSIITGVTGILSEEENKRVISASLIEPTIPADVVKLFIDDGTGFIPVYKSQGTEVVVESATGGEKFLTLKNIPLVKAFTVTTLAEPYNLSGGEVLFYQVGGLTETVTFDSADFALPGEATAQEVLVKINSTASLAEARVTEGGTKVRIFSRANQDEQIKVEGGSANNALAFPTDINYTLRLYLNRNGETTLLSKDGITAALESGNPASYDFSGFDYNFAMQVDGRGIQYARLSGFALPEAATAQEVADSLESQIAGIDAFTSSEDTRVAITSKTDRSSTSSLRVISDFTNVVDEQFATQTDITLDVQGANGTIFASNLAYLYCGHADVKFSTVYYNATTFADQDLNVTVEFWDGSAWVETAFLDTTIGFTQRGNLGFYVPTNWEKTVVDGNSGYWVRVRRVNPTAAGASGATIRIVSGNELLGFSNDAIVGANKDYTLNRYIGQIELETPLEPLDQIVVGSTDTNANVISQVLEPYQFVGGEDLLLEVDGFSLTVTFDAADLGADLNAVSASTVSQIISAQVKSVVSEATLSGAVKIKSNKLDGGSIKVVGGSANAILQFPTETKFALSAQSAARVSGEGPFVFDPDDTVVAVIDGNDAGAFTIPCTYAGTAGVGSTDTLVVDTALFDKFNEDVMLGSGYDVVITSGGSDTERRAVVSYSALGGVLTLDPALPAALQDGDTYQLMPRTAVRVVEFWNNRLITLVSRDAHINVVENQTRVQIASKSTGESSSVEITGGDGNDKMMFDTLLRVGLDGYKYFTGLLQETQWTVDGRDDNLNEYPGIRAAGVQVEVIEPIRKPQVVDVTVTTTDGVAVTSVGNRVKSAISSYINALPVGADVILSEIIVAVKSVSGIFDAKINFPLENVAIADSELARVAESDMTVG